MRSFLRRHRATPQPVVAASSVSIASLGRPRELGCVPQVRQHIPTATRRRRCPGHPASLQLCMVPPSAVCAMRHCSTQGIPTSGGYPGVLSVQADCITLSLWDCWAFIERRGDGRLRDDNGVLAVRLDASRAPFLSSLADAVKALTGTSSPVSIGLTGTSGVGKSHVLAMASVALGIGQLNAVVAAASQLPGGAPPAAASAVNSNVLCIFFPNAATWMKHQSDEVLTAVSVGLEMLYMRLQGSATRDKVMLTALDGILQAGRENLRDDLKAEDLLSAWSDGNKAAMMAVIQAVTAKGPGTAAASDGHAGTNATNTTPPAVSANTPVTMEAIAALITASMKTLETSLRTEFRTEISKVDAKLGRLQAATSRTDPSNFFRAMYEALQPLRKKDLSLRVVLVVDQVNTLFAQQVRDPQSANPLISFLARPVGCDMLIQSASANNEGWRFLSARSMHTLAAPPSIPDGHVDALLAEHGLPQKHAAAVRAFLPMLGNNYLSLRCVVENMQCHLDRLQLSSTDLVFDAVAKVQDSIEESIDGFLRKLSQPQLLRCVHIYYHLRHGIPINVTERDRDALDLRYANLIPKPADGESLTWTVDVGSPLMHAATMTRLWKWMDCHVVPLSSLRGPQQYEELMARCVHRVLGPADKALARRTVLYCVEAVPRREDMAKVVGSVDFRHDGLAVLRPAACTPYVDFYVFSKCGNDGLIITAVQTRLTGSITPVHPDKLRSHEFVQSCAGSMEERAHGVWSGKVVVEFLYAVGMDCLPEDDAQQRRDVAGTAGATPSVHVKSKRIRRLDEQGARVLVRVAHVSMTALLNVSSKMRALPHGASGWSRGRHGQPVFRARSDAGMCRRVALTM